MEGLLLFIIVVGIVTFLILYLPIRWFWKMLKKWRIMLWQYRVSRAGTILEKNEIKRQRKFWDLVWQTALVLAILGTVIATLVAMNL